MMPYTSMNERKQYDGFGRIQLDDDAPDTEIADIKNPSNLSGSVGQSGQNIRRNVAIAAPKNSVYLSVNFSN